MKQPRSLVFLLLFVWPLSVAAVSRPLRVQGALKQVGQRGEGIRADSILVFGDAVDRDSSKLDNGIKRSTDQLIHFLELYDTSASSAPNSTLPPFEQFRSACLEHLRALVDDIDRSYTDMQLLPALERECWLEQRFPSVSEDGFENSTACLRFTKLLVAARELELQNRTHAGYEEFCKEYYVHAGGALIVEEEAQAFDGGLLWKMLIISAAVALLVAVGLMAAYSLRK